MANHCYNYLSFEGEAEKVIEIFKDLIEKQREHGEGVLPKGYEGRYFFDICENGEECFMFWTKWAPPTEVLSQLSQEYGVTIINDVEELSSSIYGREIYFSDGGITEEYLDDEDFDLIEFNDDGEVVSFKGEPCEVENEYELLEQLLKEKYE